MLDRNRSRLVLHGAVVLFVALVAGFGAVTDSLDPVGRSWTSVHQTLMLVGVWMLATASVYPSLVLPRRERRGLVGALVVTGYALTGSLFTQAAAGVRGVAPEGPILNTLAFGANVVVVLCGLLAAALTMLGARAALAAEPAPEDPRAAV